MRLLIVDNSDLFQNWLRNAIAELNKTIIIAQARSYKEGLALFPAFRPDMVILDIALPDGSGINLLRIIKKEKPSANVIIFTNFPGSEFRKCCMESGADHFFDKTGSNTCIRDFVILN